MPRNTKKPSSWRSVFGPDEVIQRIRPTYNDGCLNNPHKGTTTFQRFNGDPLYPGLGWDDCHGPEEFPPPANVDLHNDRYPPTRMSYCRWLWSVLEPRKGEFRWDLVDAALATAAARGQTLQVRTQPFIGVFTPEWYWQTGARTDKRHLAAGGLRVPCHNDPRYWEHWGDHIRAWGKRYDGHPNLESFDIAYGGACGETGGNASRDSAAELVDAYLDAFHKTQLVSMLGTHGCTYAAKVRGRNIGWRADCLGDCRTDGKGQVPDGLNWNHMLELYPAEVETCGVKDAWRTAPVTLETCWTVPHWLNEGWDVDWILDQACKYHVSVFMPKSVYIPEQCWDKVLAFHERIGYRFHLHNLILPLEAAPGGRAEIQVTLDNKGTAPIYRPYRFALRFTQGKRHHVVPLRQDIRTWLPDFTYFREHFRLPADLRRGVAAVACGIIDHADRPVVRLAIQPHPADEGGWHHLTHVDVV